MIALILLLIAIAAGRRTGGIDKEPGGSGGSGGSPPQQSAGLSEFRRLASAGGLSSDQVDFLSFVAYGESGLKSDVGLGIPELFPQGTRPNMSASASAQMNEAKAAQRAYENSLSWLAECGQPYPPAAYGFGSGGLFAFLPAYALAQFRGSTLACESPYRVFDPPFAIAAAYGFARGLTQRSGYLGTWESLRAGWGLPSQMDNLERIAGKREKWRKHLRAVGLDESLLSKPAPSFGGLSLEVIMRRIEAAQ
jgi:hypothetical protein